MKSLFFSLFIIGSFTVSGQCAKKQRRQLIADCAAEQQKQEEALAVFGKSKTEFDSVKMTANNKIGSLKKGERKLLDSFFTYSGLLYQLKQLNAELPPLIHSFKSEEVPVHSAFIAPIENTLSTVFIFEKVPEKADLGDLSVKEQNKVLRRKLDEYKRYSLSNSIRLVQMKESSARISAFLPRMDSMSQVYEVLANDMTSESWKMQDKLKIEEATFRKKGPKDFPEAYFLIFPEVFPGFLPAEELNVPIENTSFEYSSPIGIEHKEPEIFEWTEDAAVFPGGREKMNEFVSANLRNPESVQQGIISGKVYVKFVVSEKGEVSAAQVLKGIPACPECGEEAIRLINSMPNWIPAAHEGKKVKSYVGLPVKFEL